MGMFEPMSTDSGFCTKEEFNGVIKDNLLDLIDITVNDGQLMGMPEPRNSPKEIYSQCSGR